MKAAIQLFALLTFGALVYVTVIDGEDKKPRSPSTNKVVKQMFEPLFKELEEKGYWVDLVDSLELSVNVMQDNKVLDIVKTGKKFNNIILRDLNNLINGGSASFLLTEMDTFCRQLIRKGYNNIEIVLVRVDISGFELKDREDRVLHAMIQSGGSLERVKYGGVVGAELKERISHLHKMSENKISVPVIMTFEPHKEGDKHLFVANISISFYCMKNNRSDVKVLRFDLYLNQLKVKKPGTFSYPWGVENVLPRNES